MVGGGIVRIKLRSQHTHPLTPKTELFLQSIVIRGDHINQQTLPGQFHLVHLGQFPVVISNNGNSSLVRLHHYAVGLAIAQSAYFRETTRYELALVHGVVVQTYKPSAIFGEIRLIIVGDCDLLLFLLGGGGWCLDDRHSELSGGGGHGRRLGGQIQLRRRRRRPAVGDCVMSGIGHHERRRRQD